MLIMLLIMLMSFGKYVSGAATQCLLHAVAFPWAICMICRKHLEEGYEKNAAFRWVCAYLVMFVLSTLVTMSANAKWSTIILSAMTAALFMLCAPRTHTKENMRREILILAVCMVCLYMPFELLALLSVFTGKLIYVPLFPGPIGISEAGEMADRIRIFTNTNTVAIYAAVNMLLSVYVVCSCRKKWVKAFFVFAVIVNYVTLAHTQSRTTGIAFSTAAAAIVLRGVCLKLEKKKWRWLIAAAAAVLAFFILLNGINVIYKADVTLAYRMAGREADFVSPIDRKGQFDVSSSGRSIIWISTLKYLKNHPATLLFGNGQVDSIELIGAEYPEVQQYINIHNSYLGAVFYCGVPFLICIFGFLCTLVCPALRLLMQKETEHTRGNFVIPAMIGMLLIMAVGEEMLFMLPSYPNMLFFLFAGYLLKFGATETSAH